MFVKATAKNMMDAVDEEQCVDCDDIRDDLVLSEWGDNERVCPGCEARRCFEYGLPPVNATGSSSSLLCEAKL